MLTIQNLHAGIEGKKILKGINLEINQEKCMLSWDRMVPAKAHWLRYWQEEKNMK